MYLRKKRKQVALFRRSLKKKEGSAYANPHPKSHNGMIRDRGNVLHKKCTYVLNRRWKIPPKQKIHSSRTRTTSGSFHVALLATKTHVVFPRCYSPVDKTSRYHSVQNEVESLIWFMVRGLLRRACLHAVRTDSFGGSFNAAEGNRYFEHHTSFQDFRSFWLSQKERPFDFLVHLI